VAASYLPAGFHLMTPLKSEAIWSSVQGSVTGFGGGGGAGVIEFRVGVSTSIASSSRAGVAAWVLARPPLFLGGMLTGVQIL
jgi:hypothetical protein